MCFGSSAAGVGMEVAWVVYFILLDFILRFNFSTLKQNVCR